MATDITTGDDYEDRGSGWLVLAGTVLGLAGLMRIIDAIWAFRYNGQLPDNLQDGVLGDNLTGYAWTWLIVGIILVVIGRCSLPRRYRSVRQVTTRADGYPRMNERGDAEWRGRRPRTRRSRHQSGPLNRAPLSRAGPGDSPGRRPSASTPAPAAGGRAGGRRRRLDQRILWM